MRKINLSASDLRINALLCCNSAILLSVSVAATAVPIVSFSSATVDFGSVLMGKSSDIKVVTIKVQEQPIS